MGWIMDRDAFLHQVRQAVAEGNRAGAAPAPGHHGAIGYQGAGADPVERFRAELAIAGGQTHLVPDREAAAAKVVELIQEAGGRRILIGAGELLQSLDLPQRLATLGLDVATVDNFRAASVKDRIFAADVGVSGVHALVAETGTIVVATGPEEPRSLSLLPPVHIAVASRTQVFPDLFDLFDARETQDGAPSRLPSCLTLITGPSKTGDIELRLVTGVHGPGVVHVVLLSG